MPFWQNLRDFRREYPAVELLVGLKHGPLGVWQPVAITENCRLLVTDEFGGQYMVTSLRFLKALSDRQGS